MSSLINSLNRVATMAVERVEIVGALFALALVFMLIIPLPLPLIDALIAINISASCLLIVLAMYLPKPLAFSTFPAVLLLTTMFRLALSISTTRQILLEQDAGHIVAAFGEFVVGGNLAVGFIIFMILTLVNFLVITKGSERVAEVAARFTLDAMPGKQMSIDSDLRAGLIDSEQARLRRVDLGKESQLFGAMDGAMKFVKGDAIASLIILFINLIGGISIGILQKEMTGGEALHVYSILTVGDGLIAQIPALLISLTAGMMITRVSSGDDDPGKNNIGREITTQIASQPKAWIMSAVGMFCFGLLPGMPTLIFFILGLITIACGSWQIWSARRQQEAAPTAGVEIPPEENGLEDIRAFDATREYLLSFPAGRQNDPAIVTLLQEIRKVRNRIVDRYGFTLPRFEIEYNPELAEDEFRFNVYEIPRLVATISPKMVVDNHWGTQLAGDETVAQGQVQRQEQHWIWLDASHPLLQQPDVMAWTSDQLLLARLEHTLFSSSAEFLGLKEATVILRWLENDQPELAQEFQRQFPVTRLTAVLRRLVAERIPLRSLRKITESLIAHGQHERDINILIDQVRIDMKEHICREHVSEQGLMVWLLTPEVEEILRDSLRQTQSETFFALDPDQQTLLLEKLRAIWPPFARNAGVMLTAQDLRSPLRQLIEQEFNHVPVISFAELQFNLPVNIMGYIDLNPANDDEAYAAEGAMHA